MENTNNIKIGVFVLISIALVILLFIAIGGSSKNNEPITGEVLNIIEEQQANGPEVVMKYNCDQDFSEIEAKKYCEKMQKFFESKNRPD